MALRSSHLVCLLLLDIFSKTECHDCKLGYYGNECENQCGHCVGGPIFCDSSSGYCVNGCAWGYAGDTCSKRCPPGTFGASCSQKCSPNCRDPDCDFVKGNCSDRGCKPGYHGSDCTLECPADRYGEECAMYCDCASGCGCDPVDGTCHPPEKCHSLDPRADEGKTRWKRADNDTPALLDVTNQPDAKDRNDTLALLDVTDQPHAKGRNDTLALLDGTDRPDAKGRNGTPNLLDVTDQHDAKDQRGKVNKPQGPPPKINSAPNIEKEQVGPILETQAKDDKSSSSSTAGTQMMCSKLEKEFSDLKEKLNNKVDIPVWPLVALLLITAIIMISWGIWDIIKQYRREVYMAKWEKENLDKTLQEAAMLTNNWD